MRKDNVKWEWFVEDVIEYLNRGENYRTTQQILGFKELFRGYVVKDWFGHNEECITCKEHNKIIVTMCVRYYWKCWEHRNEWHNKPEILRKRVMEWYRHEVKQIINSECVDVERYVKNMKKTWKPERQNIFRNG